jgi:hypothetical protein
MILGSRAGLKGLHGRSLRWARPHRLARGHFLPGNDHYRTLLEARRDCFLDRAAGALPTSQRVEACLLRLIERKLKRREPVEAIKRQL